jgi:hypothetical protein
VHSKLPSSPLYAPGTHRAHGPLGGRNPYPSIHTQLCILLLPAVEVTPSPQLRHVSAVDAPTVGEYLPAAQLVHVAEVEAPVAVEYLPALQSWQPALPAAVLYLPAPHAVHVPPSDPE